MKLFVRGGIGLVAVLFALFLVFNARPLSAETSPSQQPAQQEQQDKKEQAGTSKEKQTESQSSSSSSDTDKLSGAVSQNPASAVKDTDATAAPVLELSNSKEASAVASSSAPLVAPQTYVATSYSLRGRGASGLGVRQGTIAADPRILPFGTRVRLDAGPYSGEYVVTDAGTAIKGRKIDVWVPTYKEACRFGRRTVKLTVLSYGGKRRQK